MHLVFPKLQHGVLSNIGMMKIVLTTNQGLEGKNSSQSEMNDDFGFSIQGNPMLPFAIILALLVLMSQTEW